MSKLSLNIERQKQIAQEVYASLTLIDPSCILAGGAPRDWYLGTEANDLDFYFCSTASTVGRVKEQLNRLGFEVQPSVCPLDSGLYESMPGLVRIWNCDQEDIKIQFIEMTDPKHRWDVVNNMDVSICKAWYTQKGQIVLHQDFKLTLASKIMFLKEGYNWSNKHGRKMIERFDTKFAAGTKEQAVNSVVSKALLEIQ